MNLKTLKTGKWYPAQAGVRAHFREYRKGILVRGNHLGIIFNYVGARRTHYGDRFDLSKMEISYVGEGKRGDQTANARNVALQSRAGTNQSVQVFFDCGDVFPRKHLLFGGEWRVARVDYGQAEHQGRKVFRFLMAPQQEETGQKLRLVFDTLGADKRFERDLATFAKARARLYAQHPLIMRARDSVAGEVGEYFAIKAFNLASPARPLIRLGSSHKDADAVQIDTGNMYAIKSISKVPSTTSSIWGKSIEKDLVGFLVAVLDRDTLRPERVVLLPMRLVTPALVADNHQKTRKLKVTADLLERGTLLAV